MAQRRMFSPDIVCSEEFLDMGSSARDLYFQLGMRADDDGFIQPKTIMRLIGAAEDDLKVLLAKRFLLSFKGGVVVIKHWLIHNMIRQDRYKPTRFQEEKKALQIKENKAYTELWQPNGNQMAPQVRLGKVSISSPSASLSIGIKKDEIERELVSIDDQGYSLAKVKEPREPNMVARYNALLKHLENKRQELMGDNFKFAGARTRHYKALKELRDSGFNAEQITDKWMEMCKDKWWSEHGFTLENLLKDFERKPL